MDKMVEMEAEYEEDEYKLDPQKTEQRKWVQIYQYSYNESLTGCVAQLEELERYTKLIVGEHGYLYLPLFFTPLNFYYRGAIANGLQIR
jgi:hypothetical protein